jgi:hypothetical protein
MGLEIDIGINHYSIIGQHPDDQHEVKSKVPVIGEQPTDYRGLLPAANIDPDSYLRQAPEAREEIIKNGVVSYLQRVSSSERQNLDPLVVAPIIEELAFLTGNQDPYSWAATESLVQLTPYLGDSRGPWDQSTNLARMRLTIILNTLANELLPLVKRHCAAPRVKLGKIPKIQSLDDSREIGTYIDRLYQRLRPGGGRYFGSRQQAPDAQQGDAIFQYSGWLAVIGPGLMNLATIAGGGYKRSFPSNAMIAVLNHCYQQHDIEYWRENEEQFFAELQQLFQGLIITLARMGVNWPSIDDGQQSGVIPRWPVVG